VSTAQRQEEHNPNFTPLRTPEEVRRYVAAHAPRHAARYPNAVRRRKLFRRATLLFLLCFSSLQYYFLGIGLEILSIPGLIAFVPTVAAGQEGGS
jgi:hypothetical protein